MSREASQKLELRARWKQLLLAALSLLIALALLAVHVWQLVERFSDSDEPWLATALEIDVDAAGRASMRGCSAELAQCISDADEHENLRPGGRRTEAMLNVAPGAPREAVVAARTLLLQHHFIPAERVP